MARCKQCRNLHVQEDENFNLEGTIKELYQSADDGCITCSLLRQVFQRFFPHEPDTAYELYTVATALITDTLHPADMQEQELTLRVKKDPFDPMNDIELYALPGNPSPWNAVSLRSHIPLSTDSPESITFARDSLRECFEAHGECGDASAKSLPYRLIDIGEVNTGKVHIVETLGMDPAKTRYCALSHCWGPPETITTQLNDRTYEQYKSAGIDVVDLPRTFGDAAVFARSLGYHFLWIDALCIIQGNRDDWLSEGSRMCEIYENSVLTLSAASSKDGNGGLFFRSDRWESGEISSGVSSDTSRTSSRIFARHCINHRFFDFPLLGRAWVLQERMLSPRTLFFTQQELVWECRRCNRCQCSPVVGGFRAQEVSFPTNGKLLSKSGQEMAYLAPKWHQIIKVYSHLKLTRSLDKFLAIDGVAQKMAQARPEAIYLAGLWSDSIFVDLLWYVMDKTPRSQPWRAPTWSWTSMDDCTIIWPRSLVEENARDSSTDMSIRSTVMAEDHFSVVKWPQPQQRGHPWDRPCEQSRLILRGVLVETTISAVDIVVNISPCLYADCPATGGNDGDKPIYCLRIAQVQNGHVFSLALRRIGSSGNDGLFERYGLLWFHADPARRNRWSVKKCQHTPPTVDAPQSIARLVRRNRFRDDFRTGYPDWWVGESVHTVTIL